MAIFGTQRRARRRRWLLLGGVAALVVAWAIAVALSLLATQRHARAALDHLELARDEATLSADGPTADHLHAARPHVDAARHQIRRPWMAPLRVLPVAGRQVRSLDALAAAADVTVDTALEALPLVEDAESELHDPTARADVLERMAEAAGAAHARLADLDLGPDDGLVAPLADARARFARELTAVVQGLERAAAVGHSLADLLEGTDRYLLLAGNNAEMRAGSGMFLMAGELRVTDGQLSLTAPESTADITLDEPVDVDSDVARHWGWASPGSDWRNLALTPRFDVTARQAAEMWQRHTGTAVDGVLAVDVVTIEAMVEALGAVDVDGVTYDAESTRRELLHDQYVQAAGGRAERHERLGIVAGLLVERLEDGRWSPRSLATALSDAIAGRHLLAWSRHATQQHGWETAGIAGALSERSVMVTLVNRSGTKADPFVDVDVDVTARRLPDDRVQLTLTVTVANHLPEGEPVYVAGPNPDGDLAEGEYSGVVTVHAPSDASTPRFDEGTGILLRGEDGRSKVAGAPVRVGRGETATVVAHFAVPDPSHPLLIEPSARVPPVEWRTQDDAWTDTRRRRLWPLGH